MKLVMSLALGSAAVLTVSAAAQAADLPSRKAAPVEYVKICDVYGAGFFYIPGTDTCLRVGGYVRTEYDYTPGQDFIQEGDVVNAASSKVNAAGTAVTPVAATLASKGGQISQRAANQDQSGWEFRGRVDLDARTQSNWGTVQTVVNIRAANTDGMRTDANMVNFGAAEAVVGNGPSSLTMERAYIRFAGFTFGLASENFSTFPPWFYSATIYPGFPNGMKQLVYTATFGGGWSATVGLESRGDVPQSSSNSAQGTVAPSAVPDQNGFYYVNQPDTGYNLVGVVRLDQSWGYAQANVMAGNNTIGYNYTNGTFTSNSATCTANPTSCTPLYGPQKYGSYAIGGSFRWNVLPALEPAAFGPGGDVIIFQGQYAHGMTGMLSSSGGMSDISDSQNGHRFLGGVQRVDSNMSPTLVTAAGVPIAYGSNEGWSIAALYTHYWTPDWRSNFGASYIDETPPKASPTFTAGCVTGWTTANVTTATACTGLNTQWGEGREWELGTNLIWSPVKNFDIGVEVEYINLSSVLQNPNANFIAAGGCTTVSNGVGGTQTSGNCRGLQEDGWNFHLRLERQF